MRRPHKDYRKNNQQSLKEVINELMKSYQLNPKINEARVINSWERLMGRMIAKNTRYIAVKNGVLILQITNAPLKQELFYARDKIKQIVNKELGEEFVKEVVIR